MRRRPRTTLLLSLFLILLFAAFSLHLSRDAIDSELVHVNLPNNNNNLLLNTAAAITAANNNHVVHDDNNNILNEFSRQKRRVSSITFKDEQEYSVSNIIINDSSSESDSSSISSPLSTVSILLPDWEILLIVSPNTPSDHHEYSCLFRNNAISPAKFSGVIPFSNRTTFTCDMPESVRRRRIFSQPILVTGSSSEKLSPDPEPMELMRWNFLVYESFSTEDDVVLFAKGVNHRQGYGRSPNELRCVFNGNNGIIHNTPVTHSVQEVFRCPHPDPSELGLLMSDRSVKVKVSIEIIGENVVVPSVAYYYNYYSPPRPNDDVVVTSQEAQPKYLLCACTMVFNVAKFLREWVMYHSRVGIENFVLYDNNSDDDLEGVVNELRGEGYNITTLLWIWPKTQEAGFSHSILYSKSKGLCKWTMYADVDEFVYSPSWGNETHGGGHGSSSSSRTSRHAHNKHDDQLISSMLPPPALQENHHNHRSGRIGQVSIRCLEFGPSGQREHPVEGVTQGYTCRRRGEQRHKSIVLVDAVDKSLRNVIHHFEVNEKEGFRSKQIGVDEGLVNHYKYQAWDEFKSKFRRRVSAYVVDWRQAVNPNSKDRTPGLGFEAVEPKDWSQRFCEVRDQRLKSLTRAWFGSFTEKGYRRMAWQSS